MRQVPATQKGAYLASSVVAGDDSLPCPAVGSDPVESSGDQQGFAVAMTASDLIGKRHVVKMMPVEPGTRCWTGREEHKVTFLLRAFEVSPDVEEAFFLPSLQPMTPRTRLLCS